MENGIPIQAQLCLGVIIVSIPFLIRAAIQDFRNMARRGRMSNGNNGGFLSFLVALFIFDDMDDGGWM